MADKIPVKAILTAGNTSALGEFNPGDTLGVTFGGTGADNAASARTNLGLGNVDNTSDLNKPVSTAQASAISSAANTAESNAKAASTPIAHVGAGGTAHANVVAAGAAGFMTGADKAKLDGVATGANNYSHPAGDGNLHVPATSTTNNGKVLKAGATAGSAAWGTLAKADVGLGSVDNTADADKPVSTAQQSALDLKAPLASPTFTGTVAGITKAMVGLSNVDNTTDAGKPVSTAQQTALNLKQDTSAKDATGGYAGLTLFKLNLRNAANTITSWFTTAATVARTWTMPDKDGTVAMTSDITGVNSGTNTGDETAATIRTKYGTAALATGILKNTVTTGAPSIAVAGDFPILNQNTSGSSASCTGNAGTATKLQTARNINGVSFDGSADITVADSTKAVKGANSDITSLSGLTTALTVTQGGTGRNTGTTAYGLIAAGTTAAGAQQTLAAGLTTQILVGGGASALPVWTNTTGSGSPVRATSPTLVTPKIGVATGTSFNSITGLSSTTPTMDGVAAVGTGTTTARADHVHPTDTSRAPIASPSFTGTLTHSGDVVISGSGKRITGDFSNDTIANRLMFQTSTPASYTAIGVIPSAGGSVAHVSIFSNADPLSSNSQLQLLSTTTYTAVRNLSPAGTYTPLIFHTGNAERLRIDANGNVLVNSPAGLGYGTGAGGAVTQATNKTTAVTLNKPCGQITTHNAALAAGASVIFTVNNTVVGETDCILFSTVGTTNYRVEQAFAKSGQFGIRLTNLSAGSLSNAVVINFAIIKGALS